MHPTIIGMSALLTTTMTYMKTVIDGFKAAGRRRSRLAIGGAPISQMFADEIGADGYGQNASSGGGFVFATREEELILMATYKILYWQDIPSQIKVEDAQDEISVEMPPEFMERIDKVAHQKGLQNADDYLAQWQWSEEEERDGTAQEVAEAVKAELVAKADW